MTTALCVVGALAFLADSHAFAQSTPTKSVEIDATKPWTDTGITVRAGESVTVTVDGEIHIGPGELDAMVPAGIPRGAKCDELAQVRGFWVTDTLPCWSAMARVGRGQPIGVGAGATFKAPADGPLQLGVNDNRFVDNEGSWNAIVVAESAADATDDSAEGSGGSTLPMIVAVVGGLLIVGLIVFAVRRRRSRGDATDDARTRARAARVAVPAMAGSAAPEAVEPEPEEVREPTAGQQTVVPGADETVRFNIFEVSVVDGTALRVGYNYFPEGTLVRWRILQADTVRAVGEFVTNGGGSTYHFVTMPLDVALQRDAGGTDVYFSWSIGGVPFEYSVLRQQIA
jgi:hypothetical protein